jgi:hypothetical protein
MPVERPAITVSSKAQPMLPETSISLSKIRFTVAVAQTI